MIPKYDLSDSLAQTRARIETQPRYQCLLLHFSQTCTALLLFHHVSLDPEKLIKTLK